MVKVITYGTYDLLHYGHIRLLERAKALGDYLIVGVTADDFDKSRGKINVQQSLMERIEAVRATGVADEIIVEEYEGQKIDDIRRYDVDIFTVGSDWIGKFDYLKEYCEVVYLERTQGISSTELRAQDRAIQLGLVGESSIIEKYLNESKYVNGLEVTAICCTKNKIVEKINKKDIFITPEYDELLEKVDAVYVASLPNEHFVQIEKALMKGKHVLCESPVSVTKKQCEYLFSLAKSKNLILMDAIKTAYGIAYNRLLLLIKSGCIGSIISIDATCTSLKEMKEIGKEKILEKQSSLCAWGPTALLPIFQLLGVNYDRKKMSSWMIGKEKEFDLFTKIEIKYPNAVASVKVGKGVKSEGDLVISGTNGYIYVPAPWWKTDYFEIRRENQEENKRYFYQLDGEGIRYELISFLKSIKKGKSISYIEQSVTEAISLIIEDFNRKYDLEEILINE